MNRAFYARRGAAFDASRDHPWPGWSRALGSLEAIDGGDPRPLRVLDLGCGNGRFGAWLMHRATVPTRYLGIDASAPLLDRAREAFRASPPHFEVELEVLDFLDGAGPEALPEGPFDLIGVFGVLHHVPGEDLRRRLVVALAERLAAGGRLVLTAWQFGAKARFERSLLSDAEVRARAEQWGFDADDLEPGDHFLGFGGDASVPRYCHALGEAEIDSLTRASGLALVDAYLADGKSGDLNAYRVLEKQPS
jgi:SAM-dependent methyltransferase